MKTTHIVLLLSLTISLWSCVTHRMQRSLDNVFIDSSQRHLEHKTSNEEIYFEKTACFGPCPAFKFIWKNRTSMELTITRPFNEGPLSSLQPGEFQGILDPEKARKHFESINESAASCQYNSLNDEYDNPRITDLPATITTIKGKRVKVRYGGPDLNNLYTALQLILDETRWEPKETKPN
ncbi:MAG: hypothetical protein CL834_02750 [Crocinitomicaceae bacterium]|nr:hypothetical protein [Crocinitomicaceae bacterium]|tara:strand:+ start:286 stop:825 length:540 start_codon:yes stop_codon:yes gene_type:complete